MKKINSVEDIKDVVNNGSEVASATSENSKETPTKGCTAGFTITKEIEELDNLKTKMFKYISYKKRTENEVREKFAEYDEDLLEQAIEYFKEQKYIDDFSYIERSVQEFYRLKNLSIQEIRYKLLQKGVNKKEVDGYVVENKEELLNFEIQSAKKLILKKRDKSEIEDIKKYLFSKGYMSESISIALDEMEE